MMLKRTVTCLLAVLLLAAIAIPSLAAGAMQQGSMYVNTANGKALRFRSSRSTSADNVLVEIPYGTKVYVNYSNRDYKDGGTVIPARDYKVERGNGQ